MSNKELFEKGDVIGDRYEVRDTLGKGGFGVVYLVFDRKLEELAAIKTFRDELLANPKGRNAFKKESLLWVNLEAHPHILAARWVSEISGRLFVKMDYIAPDAQERVSLYDHLATANGPLDINQVLGWAIQFCLGMEHAQARGLKYHRDIKPGNILIAPNWSLKIADFGLAAAAAAAWDNSHNPCDSLMTGTPENPFGFSIVGSGRQMRCGTPGYISPEVFRCEPADTRSDIYSFGVVLWQMATGSRAHPFKVAYKGNVEVYLQEIYEEQISGRLPSTQGLLKAVVEKCMQIEPFARYANFRELREGLENFWKQKTGTDFPVPQAEERTTMFWNNKGGALNILGRSEEAIVCFDRALAIDLRNATAWSNKISALNRLGRYQEAIECFDKILELGTDSLFAGAWINKGIALKALGHGKEAIECFDKALELDTHSATAWGNKGIALEAVDRRGEAIECYDRALTIDSRSVEGWINKSGALGALGRFEEIFACVDNALSIDPCSVHAWFYRAVAFDNLGRHEEAIECFNKALTIDPLSTIVWNDKGAALFALGRHREAINCYKKVVTINPRDAKAWFNKAISEDFTKDWNEALNSYKKFIDLAQPQDALQLTQARQRIRKLESAV